MEELFHIKQNKVREDDSSSTSSLTVKFLNC